MKEIGPNMIFLREDPFFDQIAGKPDKSFV